MIASEITRHGGGLGAATRVLTADLRWIPIADLEVGQALVACDEHAQGRPARGSGCRKMRTAVVEGVRRTSGPAYRMRCEDGRVVVCSLAHPWLSWRRVGRWRSIGGSGRHELRPGDFVRAIAPPWGAPDLQDAWFGGVVDGEASFVYARRSGACLSVVQCDGPVLQRMLGHCVARRYDHGVASPRMSHFSRRPVHAIWMSAMPTIFRALGLSRPERFIGVRWWEGRGLPNRTWRAIAAIDPLDEMELVEIRTSTRTYVAEGFVAHDATFIDPACCPALHRERTAQLL